MNPKRKSARISEEVRKNQKIQRNPEEVRKNPKGSPKESQRKSEKYPEGRRSEKGTQRNFKEESQWTSERTLDDS